MLMPDNMQPENSIYFNGAIVLQKIKLENNQTVIELYREIKDKMTFPVYVLCLDWLYLLEIAKVDESGCVKLCL